MEKPCIICSEWKPLSEFYKHPKMSDGHINKCKTCTKKQTAQRLKIILSTPEGHDKEKQRHREKYYRLNYKEKHKPTFEKKKETMTRYKEKYPEKVKARTAVGKNNLTTGVHNHHWSYNEIHYKDTIPLSEKDHNKLHRYMVYDQERMMYRRSDNLLLLDTKELHIEYFNSLADKV